MAFSSEVIEQAWYRQGELCAGCGKRLAGENRYKGEWGAWHPHHKKPLAWGGSDLLRNCAILCINPPNCHLNLGHDGDFRNYVQLYDSDLPYLYAGEM